MIEKMMRPLTAAILALSLVSLTGCTQSNESAAGIEGVDPTANSGGPPPKSQEEYMKQTQQSGASNYKSQGYPGAR